MEEGGDSPSAVLAPEASHLDGEQFGMISPSINKDDALVEDSEEKVTDVESIEAKKEDKRMPWWRLMLLTISFSGCIMCWSVEIANATPFLLEIGVPKTYVNYNWLIGPLSALFVQPIVGILSDKIYIPCIGRRKPWLVVGCFLCTTCLILFSWCDVIGGKSKKAGIVIGIFSFCVCDGSINTLHSAIKTLTIDVVPVHQQTECNLFLSFFAGMGNALGFFIGYIDFIHWFKWKFFGRNIRPVYLICSIWLVVSCAITFFSTWETKEGHMKQKQKRAAAANQAAVEGEGEGEAERAPLLAGDEGEALVPDPELPGEDEFGGDEFDRIRPPDDSFVIDDQAAAGMIDENEPVSVKRSLCQRCCICLRQFPTAIVRSYLVRFMIYFAKFWTFVYMSDYVGRQVYHGDPTGNPELVRKYDDGVRWGSLCFCILSIFNMVNSPIINFLSGYIPIRIIWGLSQSTHFIGLSMCYWISNKWLLIVVFYFLSFMETCCISFPYAILNAAVKTNACLTKYKGVSAGIFVSSQCFPEILVALLGGVLVKWLINDNRMPPGVMISIGGLCAGVALILILYIKVPEGMIKKANIKESCFYYACRVAKRRKERREASESVVEESIAYEEDPSPEMQPETQPGIVMMQPEIPQVITEPGMEGMQPVMMPPVMQPGMQPVVMMEPDDESKVEP